MTQMREKKKQGTAVDTEAGRRKHTVDAVKFELATVCRRPIAVDQVQNKCNAPAFKLIVMAQQRICRSGTRNKM